MMRHRSAPAGQTWVMAQGGEAMTETQGLLGKIAALRQRLEQAQGLAREAGSAAAALSSETRDAAGRIWRLERRVAHGAENADILDASLRQLAELSPIADGAQRVPQRLTSRARRILERAQGLLVELRELSSHFETAEAEETTLGHPLAARYHQTSAMVELILRVIQGFPDSASGQLRLCEGVE